MILFLLSDVNKERTKERIKKRNNITCFKFSFTYLLWFALVTINGAAYVPWDLRSVVSGNPGVVYNTMRIFFHVNCNTIPLYIHIYISLFFNNALHCLRQFYVWHWASSQSIPLFWFCLERVLVCCRACTWQHLAVVISSVYSSVSQEGWQTLCD